MIDSKAVINQVQELQVIPYEIHAEGMSLSEYFQVASIIEKLRSLWKDFKNYLKHKQKDMKLEDLIVRLRIEENNRHLKRKQEKRSLKLRQMWLNMGRISRRGKTLPAVQSKVSMTTRRSKGNAMCETN
ncbi:hypothetical protein AAC387_Pa03g1027 [Persea americana]